MKLKNLLTISLQVLFSLAAIAQNGPGGVGNTTGNSSLQLWLKASDLAESHLDGDKVLTWTDQSGASNHVHGVNPDTPIFKKGTAENHSFVEFNGNQFLQTKEASSSFSSSSATIFLIRKGINKGAAIAIAEQGWVNEMLLLGNDQYHHSSSGNFVKQAHPCIRQIPSEELSIVAGVFGQAPKDLRYFVNGVEASQTLQESKSNVRDFEQVDRKVTIGQRDQFVSSEFYEGDLLEVIVYNRQLNDEEIAQVQKYLQCTYQIQPSVCSALNEENCESPVSSCPILTEVIDTNPLQLWLKASDLENLYEDGGKVVKWEDQSGANNHVVSDLSKAPTFQKESLDMPASVEFGGGQFLQTDSVSSSFNNPESTIFLVKQGAYKGAAISIAERGWVNEMLLFNYDQYHHSSSGNFVKQSHPCIQQIPSDELTIVAGVFGQSPRDLRYFVNGEEAPQSLQQSVSNVRDFESVDRKVTIGQRDQFVASEYFEGGLLEILVFNKTLNDEEIEQVENYLACSYQIEPMACSELNMPNEESDNPDSLANNCFVTISNEQYQRCLGISVFDEQDNFLVAFPVDSSLNETSDNPYVWIDNRPLAPGAIRTYILKDNKLVVGRYTVTCDNPYVEIFNRYPVCFPSATSVMVHNTGCRAINVFANDSRLLTTIPSKDSLSLELGLTNTIFVAENDTLDIVGKYSEADLFINSEGCSMEDENPNNDCNCPQVVEPVCGVDGKFYNNSCVADCAGVEVDSSGTSCDLNDRCVVIIKNGYCTTIGIYDENDTLLTEMKPGIDGFDGFTFWEDLDFLLNGTTRNYVFKENGVEVDRRTASCEEYIIELVSDQEDPCADTLENTTPLDTLENTTPLDTLENTTPLDTLENTTPLDTLENTTPLDTLENTTPLDTLENTTPLDTLENTTPLDTLENTTPLDTMENTTPLDTLENTTPLDTLENTTPLDTMENTTPLDTMENMTPLDTMENTTPLDTMENTTPLDTMENTTPLDTMDMEETNTGNTDQSVCAAPIEPIAIVEGSKKVVITWTAVDAATKYVIQIRFKGQTRWAASATVRRSTVIMYGPAGKDYEYRIKSLCSEEESEYGEIFEFSTPSRGIINSESRSKDDFQADIVVPFEQLILTPNPVRNQLYVDYPITAKNTRLFIYSTTGQEVYEQSLEIDTFEHVINVANLARGLYILRIVEMDGTVISQKLVKQ